jgi:hypothetical protein
MSAKGIEVRSWILNKDLDEEEYKLLKDFNEGLTPEPLGVIGYGIRDYDLPLLSIKMKRYDPSITGRQTTPLWHIINMLERAIHLDLMIRLRFELKLTVPSKFDDIIKNPKFATLPIRRIEYPVLSKEISKGEYMYNIWKRNPEDLKMLVETHAYNILLIAEKESFNKKN